MKKDIYEGQERRKYIRIPYEAIIGYKVYKGGKNICAKGDTKNLSSGGIMLTTKENFPASTILEVDMDIPSEDGYSTVKILGKVVRAEKKGDLYENGISFYKIKAAHKKAIEEFMEFAPSDDPDLDGI